MIVTNRDFSVKSSTHQRCLAVLCLIREKQTVGRTRDAIAERSGWPIQTVCWRVSQLLDAGLVVETDVTRLTRSNRSATVLVSIDHVRNVMEQMDVGSMEPKRPEIATKEMD